MRFSLGVAALATAVVTTAAQIVAASIEGDATWITNPYLAFVGGFVITVYAHNALTRGPRRSQRPERLVTVFAVVILVVALLPIWLGGREAGFKIQMTAQFVALALCLVGLLPPIVRARNAADAARADTVTDE
jgi:hypothetical protein